MNNEYMFYIFIAFLIFFVLITVMLLAMMIYLFKGMNKQNNTNKSEEKGDLTELITTVREGFQQANEMKKGHFCKLHPGIKAAGTCAVCEEMFCEDCIMDLDGLTLCPEHFRLVNENDWSVIETIKTDSNDPEASMYVYDFKKKYWKDRMTPMYIVTHYQINVESDHIVSQVELFAKRDEQFFISSELKKYKDGLTD